MNMAYFIVTILSALSLFTPVFSGYGIGILILILALVQKYKGQSKIEQEMISSFNTHLAPITMAACFLWLCVILSGVLARGNFESIESKSMIRVLGNYGVKFVIVWIAYKMFYWRFFSQPNFAKWFSAVFAGGSVVHLVYCLLQRKYGFDWAHGFDAVLGPNRFAYNVYRISGFVGHPLTLGYCQALAFVSAVFLFGQSPNKWEKFAWGLSAVCSAVVILLSGSRGPQIAMFAGFLVLLPKDLLFKHWKIILPVVAVILVISVKIGIFDRFFELLQNGSGGDERRTHWLVHFKIFSEYPIYGIGPFAPKEAISAYYLARGASDNIMIAHNAFLQFAADFGLIGLIGICLWFGSLGFVAWKSNFASKGLWAIVTVSFVGSLFQNNFQDSEFVLALSVWILILNSFEVNKRDCARRTTSKNLVT